MKKGTRRGKEPGGALRGIPAIEQLRQRPAVRALEDRFGHAALVEALRAAADSVRRRLAAGEPPAGDIAEHVERELPVRLAGMHAASLRPVINATGVILHTNLGRAPLGAPALARIATLGGYSNLEYDLQTGARGRRDIHAERLLCRVTGAEAAVVVNNNAAATLLALAAVAAGREVIISRGELVEIGGAFRVPDVMAQSGAILREVGTTNRTRAADYAAAFSDRTAAILRVHPSNFRIEGFTERPALSELAPLARRYAIPLIEDIGSGLLAPPAPPALRDEPVPARSLAGGADLVLFSGDKLLGGPQAGILAGTGPLVGTIRRHPLMRALRVDKLTYAALEATLQEYAAGRAGDTVPVVRMLRMTRDQIAVRAEAAGKALRGTRLAVRVVDGDSTVGGGSAPGSALPTALLQIVHPELNPTALDARLRDAEPPVIARIQEGAVVLDFRTIPPEQDGEVVRVLQELIGNTS